MAKILTSIVMFLSLFGGVQLAYGSDFDRTFQVPDLDLTAECKNMYDLRETDVHYPVNPQKYKDFCSVRVQGKDYPVTASQYYALTHKSLRFICKGKRPFLLDLAASLSGCDGQQRSLSVKKQDGQCVLHMEETGQASIIPKENIEELRHYMKNMSWSDKLILGANSKFLLALLKEVEKC